MVGLILFFILAQSDVLCLLSTDYPPYLEALKGVKEVIPDVTERYVEEGPSISLDGQRDLIIAVGSASLEVASSQERVPIVFTMVLDPVSILGGWRVNNITGVIMLVSPEERLRMLKKLLPEAKDIVVVYQESSKHLLREMERGAEKWGLHVHPVKVPSPRTVLKEMRKVGKVDCIFMIPDEVNLSSMGFRSLLFFSFERRVPICGLSEKFVRAGALFALVPDYREEGRQAGEMGVRILRGEAPSKIPYAYGRRYKLLINQTVMRRFGLQIEKRYYEE